MFCTRVMRSGRHPLTGAPMMLLPPVNVWENTSATLQGAWSHFSDQNARDKYEELIEKQVIKDAVLQNATSGASLIFRLFHNLQNPMFREHDFDAPAFMHAMKPALENFHDCLGSLRNEFEKNELEALGESKHDNDSADTKSDDPMTVEEVVRTVEDALNPATSVNHWSEAVTNDPDGLAAQLAKMTSESCFDALYYSTRLELLSRAALEATMDQYQTSGKYIPGSCKVSDVALLNARAIDMSSNSDEPITEEHPEFKASERDTTAVDIAAQLDVLYAVTHDYALVGEESNSVQSLVKDGADASPAETKADASDDDEEIIHHSNLAVAVFEGWLHRSSVGKDSLRWKLAAVREPFEFPNFRPSTVVKKASSSS